MHIHLQLNNFFLLVVFKHHYYCCTYLNTAFISEKVKITETNTCNLVCKHTSVSRTQDMLLQSHAELIVSGCVWVHRRVSGSPPDTWCQKHGPEPFNFICWLLCYAYTPEGIIQPKMKILSSFTHLHVL